MSSRNALHRGLGTLWREPLCLFLLLGGFIFALDAVLNPELDENHILVQQSDLQRLRAAAVKQWNREPDAEQLRHLVDEFIREEVLYRAAIASGLERDDVIVRRRMVQKMDFLAQADVPLPEEAEVQAFYESNRQRYSVPAQLAFRQLYFAPGGAGGAASPRAQAALSALQVNPAQPVQGDLMPLAEHFVGQSLVSVARDFGERFARQLFELPLGQWQGPLQSAYGWHLVYVERHAEPQVLPLAAVRERVAADLTHLRQQQARDAAYQALRSRYQIEVAPIRFGVEVAAQ
jgi:hypothetical protein